MITASDFHRILIILIKESGLSNSPGWASWQFTAVRRNRSWTVQRVSDFVAVKRGIDSVSDDYKY